MAASPNDLTRQQLDDLDALLQRMLAQPLAKASPSVAATTSFPEPPSHLRTLPALPNLGQAPAMALSEPPISRALATMTVPNPGPAPEAFASAPLLPTELTRPRPPVEEPVELVSAAPIVATVELMTAPSVDTAPALSPLLWPLFAVNWLIEGTLKLLGPSGEVLTRPAMKSLLGSTGLMMIAAAGLWAAHGQGWIALPLDGVFKR